MNPSLKEPHATDRFMRYRNIIRLKRFLERASDDDQRARLTNLIREEKQKQTDASDPQYPY
jgi:hypothetical protein